MKQHEGSEDTRDKRAEAISVKGCLFIPPAENSEKKKKGKSAEQVVEEPSGCQESEKRSKEGMQRRGLRRQTLCWLRRGVHLSKPVEGTAPM